MLATTAPLDSFANFIPDPDRIRQRIERCETEANLLRRLLRLALAAEREAERLKAEERGALCRT